VEQMRLPICSEQREPQKEHLGCGMDSHSLAQFLISGTSEEKPVLSAFQSSHLLSTDDYSSSFYKISPNSLSGSFTCSTNCFHH
jgi:hypothetical protein